MNVQTSTHEAAPAASFRPNAIMIAGGAGLIALLIMLIVPIGLIETMVGATGLSEVAPSFAAPLGFKARMLVALTMGLFVAVTVFFVRRGGAPSQPKARAADASTNHHVAYQTEDKSMSHAMRVQPEERGDSLWDKLAKAVSKLPSPRRFAEGDIEKGTIGDFRELPKLRPGSDSAEMEKTPGERRPISAMSELGEPLPPVDAAAVRRGLPDDWDGDSGADIDRIERTLEPAAPAAEKERKADPEPKPEPEQQEHSPLDLMPVTADFMRGGIEIPSHDVQENQAPAPAQTEPQVEPEVEAEVKPSETVAPVQADQSPAQPEKVAAPSGSGSLGDLTDTLDSLFQRRLGERSVANQELRAAEEAARKERERVLAEKREAARQAVEEAERAAQIAKEAAEKAAAARALLDDGDDEENEAAARPSAEAKPELLTSKASEPTSSATPMNAELRNALRELHKSKASS